VDGEIGDGKLGMLEEYFEWDPLRKSKKREKRGNSQGVGDLKFVYHPGTFRYEIVLY
jgi:hypothetical protein